MSNTEQISSSQELSTLSESALHQQHLVQTRLAGENKLLEDLIATVDRTTRKPDCHYVSTQESLAVLNATREANEASLNRLQTLEQGVVTIQKELSQIRILSIAYKLREECTRNAADDQLMQEIVNKAALVLLSYIDIINASTDTVNSEGSFSLVSFSKGSPFELR
ncbi:hypothetical protein EV360DRAFT_76253 [Lentinula raphanica]|nr:hypothetical protein EV360DRAFT_76253 [Lentinula raphanica]